MTDQPKNQPKPEYTDDRHAPVIYFDATPACGVYNGVIGITLSVDLPRTIEPGQITVSHTVIAYLRTSVRGAAALRESLDKALLLSVPAADKAN